MKEAIDLTYWTEIIIPSMNHETYVKMIDYIEGLKNHIDDREKPLRVKSIDEVSQGNPPTYNKVHVVLATNYVFHEAVKVNNKALKGLVDILLPLEKKGLL